MSSMSAWSKMQSILLSGQSFTSLATTNIAMMLWRIWKILSMTSKGPRMFRWTFSSFSRLLPMKPNRKTFWRSIFPDSMVRMTFSLWWPCLRFLRKSIGRLKTKPSLSIIIKVWGLCIMLWRKRTRSSRAGYRILHSWNIWIRFCSFGKGLGCGYLSSFLILIFLFDFMLWGIILLIYMYL